MATDPSPGDPVSPSAAGHPGVPDRRPRSALGPSRVAAHQVSDAADATPADAPPTTAGRDATDPAQRWAERFERPALIAALAAVPATFLTLAEGTVGTTGEVINALSAAVLVAEGVVLFATTRDRRRWVRRNWWLLATIAVVVPATIWAVGPAQLLRLVRSVGALRVLRVRRIVKAGRIASDRLGLDARWRRGVVASLSLAAAAFVAVVLADPSGIEVGWVRDLAMRAGPVGVILAGVVLGVATYLAARDRDEG